MVALHATGGSTNHTLHMPAIAHAAGIQLTWQDMADLSEVVPTLATRLSQRLRRTSTTSMPLAASRFMVRKLLDAGLLHEDVHTVVGKGLRRYIQEPFLDGWQAGLARWARSKP
ncbi:MAG: dihydroxy-acid dehydratase domain-containing protein [Stutzerimonas stutzeri]